MKASNVSEATPIFRRGELKVMYEVYIETTPTDYRDKVKELQDKGWHISLISFVVTDNQPQWVITAAKQDGPITEDSRRMQ